MVFSYGKIVDLRFKNNLMLWHIVQLCNPAKTGNPNFHLWCSNVSVLVVKPTLTFFGGRQTLLVRNKLVTTLSVLRRQFQISFDFKPTKWIGGWTNVLHLTTGPNCCAPGSRIPGIFTLGGKLAMSFGIDKNGNHVIWTPKLALNRWVHFTISQTLEGKRYIYRVYMNNKLLEKRLNHIPRDYKNVKVFVADNWYNAQPGFIKNIHITSKQLGVTGEFFVFLKHDISKLVYAI